MKDETKNELEVVESPVSEITDEELEEFVKGGAAGFSDVILGWGVGGCYNAEKQK